MKTRNVHRSIAFSSAEVTSDWLAQEVSHMRSRRQANLAKQRSSERRSQLKAQPPLLRKT